MGSETLSRPRALPRGGTVGIVAPASPVSDPVLLERGVAALHAEGFRVVLGEHVHCRHGHLAGTDAQRAADLHALAARPDVDALLCARGGSGSIRLLRMLDWDLLQASRKPLLGYSDITSLQLALLRRCRRISFFAPMAAVELARGLAPEAGELLWRLVCEPVPLGAMPEPRLATAECVVPGSAEGILAGGTLALVAATLGTPFEIETAGRVVFLEDIYESPARVERMLAQLLLAGKLRDAAGLLLGDFPWEAAPEERNRYLPVRQVIQDLLAPLGLPLLIGAPIGHVPNPLPLPQGARARLDATRRTLEILDPAVQ